MKKTWNRNWSIGTKITACCSVMLLLVSVMGLVSLSTASSINAELVDATQNTARRLQVGGIIDTAGSDMLAGMRGIVMFTYGRMPSRVQGARELFESGASSWQSAMDEVRPLLVTEEGKRLIGQLQNQLNDWNSLIVDVEKAASQNRPDEALKLAITKGLPIYEANTRDSKAFSEVQNQLLIRKRATAASLYDSARWTSIAIFGISIIAGGITLLVVRRSSALLRRTTSDLSQASRQVASAAAQISSAGQALAQGASEQAASVEETSAATEQMSAMTRKNADDAGAAAKLMSEAGEVVRQANQTLGDMESSMKEINASSGKIAKIINVIDEIAFQTNILALNAAVEAARAGEAGMGFAVVADEVRNLAQRSAQAAKDTAGMIEESISRSSQGEEKLDHVSKAIARLTEKAAAVNGLIEELRSSSAEQATGIGQIATAVSQVEKVAQNAAASAEQTASAGEELNSQAGALEELVARMGQLAGTAG